MTSMSGQLCAVLTRDMRVSLRIGGGALTGVLFFLAVVTLTPFAVYCFVAGLACTIGFLA